MKKKVILLIFAVLALTFTACGQDSGRQIVIKSNGTYLNAEEYLTPSTTVKETTAEPASSPSQAIKQTDTVDVKGNSSEKGEVYWTEGGEVWHLTENCSSLSRSKNILSGSVDDAIGAGKERACMRCGK